ncbi:peptide deformylase [Brevibacterium sp. CFH 10365]|uniref:peptide deformylase n=1 Tax=Brevibacterium sp. CFH 10365 TaxID=2585207 RepID=UPI0029D41D3E|nr:peptide deformylase [Brevibacterium sp. CFH 10365]
MRTDTRPFDGQVDDAELQQLAEVMRTTMLAAPGVGLAAPQVGVSLSMFVAEDPGARDPEVAKVREREPMPLRVVLDAKYERAGCDDVAFFEGCLSIPGYQAVVARPREIALTGIDLQGNSIAEVVSGWSARIVAHETDHLSGILFLDKAEMRSLATNASVAKLWNQPSTQQAAAELGFPLPSGLVM